MLYSKLFELADTYGLPLEVAFDHCKRNGVGVNWYDFTRAAIRAGWKEKTCKDRIKYCLVEDFTDKVEVAVILDRVTQVYRLVKSGAGTPGWL
ncbi:hypothetical protein D3C81_1895610 [compost metagenome]